MSSQGALRLCVLVAELPEPYVPSEQRTCASCGGAVWYDPLAGIPELGPETIICTACLDLVIATHTRRPPSEMTCPGGHRD